ncbi:L domain-like protein [Rhizoclosmatium globosum]|uniref:L domain-like protein n=1 Tax=Rhizoclosmatium globosum TaxID=329046 RepID=A0A1Y2C0V6_9FUNG|nr:L domain-like protein [Rhizoclosmatium globosum]|eukprot:ORY40650.1 L domain-like protein [Rhizoclosmatium globosum]
MLSLKAILFLLSTCKYFSQARVKHIGTMKVVLTFGPSSLARQLQSSNNSLVPFIKIASLDLTNWVNAILSHISDLKRFRFHGYRQRKDLVPVWETLFFWFLPSHNPHLYSFCGMKRLDMHSIPKLVPWDVLVNLEVLTCDMVAFTPDCCPPKLRDLELIVCGDDFAELTCCKTLEALSVDFVVHSFAQSSQDTHSTSPASGNPFPFLSELDVLNWKTTNWSILRSITSIQWLTLSSDLDVAWETDVSSLAPLDNLQKLSLTVSKLHNIDFLQNHLKLSYLCLNLDNLSDLTPLSLLSQLETLNLAQCSSSDYDALRDLINLKVLDIRQSPDLTCLKFLSTMTQLKVLYLSETHVTNLSPLLYCSDITCLEVSFCPISDISVLANLTSLKSLCLGRTKVEDISPIAKLKRLESLSLTNIRSPDLSALSELCTQLTNLTLSHCSMTNQNGQALSVFSRLQTLDLDYNADVSDLSFLSSHQHLKVLSISHTGVVDIASLVNISTLRLLYCWGTRVVTPNLLRGVHVHTD